MSENETAVPVRTSEPETSESRLRELMADRRALVLVGAAGLAIVLLIAFVLVPALTGSSSTPATKGKVASGSGATASVTPTASATPAPLPTAAVPLSVRDPFLPLAVQGAAAGGGSGGAASAPASASTSAPISAGSTTPAAQPGATNLRQLTLVELSGPDTAKVTVNGLAYDVTLNTPFGGGFTMTGETGSDATFLYNSQTQTLVPGQYAFFN